MDSLDELNNLASALNNKEDYENAIRISRKILEIDPLNLQAMLSLALATFNKGDYDNCIIIYQKILEIDPQNETAWNNLGSAMNMKSTRMRGPF